MANAVHDGGRHVHLSLTRDEVAALDAIVTRGEKFSHHETVEQTEVATKIHESAKA